MSVFPLVVVVTHHLVVCLNRAGGAFSLARARVAVISVALLIRRQRSLAAVRTQVTVVRLCWRWCHGRSDASDTRFTLAVILGGIIPGG